MYGGKDIVQLKLLSDRRQDRVAGNISAATRKVIRIVAVTLSDEHVFNQEGGRGRGKPARGSGGYSLDPPGQPHRAMVGTKTKLLVIYTGEPDAIRSLDMIDVARAG